MAACEFKMLKRSYEEVFSPIKRERLESPPEMDGWRFNMDNVKLYSYTDAAESFKCDNEVAPFPDSCCESSKDIINEFFIDFNFQ